MTTRSQKYDVIRCLGRGRVSALYEVSDGSGKLLLQDILLKPSAVDENETAPEDICWEALDDANRVSDPKPTGQHTRDWFAREMASVSSWQVPGMPKIVAAGATEERGVVVLDPGGGAHSIESLMERVERDGPLSEEMARSVAAQVMEAAAALHSRKPSLVLGEIRPSNLVLGADGKVRFLTYGDARFIETPRRKLVTRSGSAFTSPERRGSGNESAASDVWCIGALLCFLMGGRIDEPLSVGSETLQQVVKRCLEPEASRRYLSLHDLREALAGREPARPDERPPVLVVQNTTFNGGAVLPGTVVQGSFRVRNEGGGLMAATADPEADWVTVNPNEWTSNDETVQFWCTTDKLITNNSHSSVIRIACGKQIKFVNLRLRVLPRPEMTSVAKGGWLLRLVVPIGALLVAGFTYGVTHGWAALFKLIGFK